MNFFRWYRKRRTGAVLRALPLPVLGIVLFLFAIAQGGFLSWFLFYIFIPIVLYQFILIGYPFHSIELKRSIHTGRLVAGDTLDMTLHLRRRWMLPLFFVTIRDCSEHTVQKTGMLIWYTREAALPMTFRNMRRGKYVLDTLELKTSDPFGLFERSVLLRSKQVIYVYPKARLLSSAELGMQRNGAKASVQDTDLAGFSGIRAYRPSDRPSWLDWKSAARMNSLVTKQFEPERERHASVVLVSKKEENDERFERAVAHTASLVQTLLRLGFSVLLTYGSEHVPLLLQEQLPRSVDTALKTLAELRKEQALTVEDVHMAANKKYVGYAISTDPQLAGMMRNFAEKSRQYQTMYYITDQVSSQTMRGMKSSWFSLRTVTEMKGRRDKI
ncbi:DUF58 domain-containing protein [Sporolactobacillus sp. CPB3-1]|uniref:DUF58 domain-containing protein n=1 Tax=Sporolactobacillus mangiferae TaxID=2940498 RepID=A0ABT0M8R0_9BACL|nr:DUF58 domain-containing protein [Sporolactobacillus mangiferae]MCL1630730.1 DUF58 domain-containing protein [Sporolactobacillus mangiferae]